MKVILCEHVDHLGERGEIVNVAVGYARNFLVPKGLAMAASAGNLKMVEQRKRSWQRKSVQEVSAAEARGAELAALQLQIAKKAGENDTLYGSVTSAEVAELLAAKGFAIDRRKLLIAETIKSLGEHEVGVKLHPQVTAKITLQVVAESE